MTSERRDRVELLQGTLDLIVLRALATMGPQHAYALAARLEQVVEPSLTLSQGTLYPALVRLEQKGWIKGTWQRTENNREAKYYAITKPGARGLEKETNRWRRLAGLVDKLLLDEGLLLVVPAVDLVPDRDRDVSHGQSVDRRAARCQPWAHPL